MTRLERIMEPDKQMKYWIINSQEDDYHLRGLRSRERG
jgi:hypothetical protein